MPVSSNSHAMVAVLAIAAFLVQFDITATIAVLPAIQADLAIELGMLAWVMDAYSVAFTCFLLTAGTLADRWGRRATTLAGVLLFALASLACGMAPTSSTLLAGRVAQGLAAALVICGTLALLSNAIADRSGRARAFGQVGAIVGTAMALGPVGGSVVTALAGWRWIFLANLPICLLLMLLLPKLTRESRGDTAASINWPALACSAAAFGGIVHALLHGASAGWASTPTLAALALAAVAGLLLLISQTRRNARSIDYSLFANSTFAAGCAIAFLMSIGYWAVLVYLPLFATHTLHLDNIEAGLSMLAATLPLLFLPPLGARLLSRLGSARFYAVSFLLTAAGGLSLAWVGARHDLPATFLAMALCASGAGLCNSQISNTVVGAAPQDRAGQAAALATLFRQSGFAVGIALLAVVGQSDHAASIRGPATSFDYPAVFAAAALAACCGAAAAFALRRAPSGQRAAA